MLSNEHNKIVNKDDDVGCITKTAKLTLKADFTVSDVRAVQKFLHLILEARSRLT